MRDNINPTQLGLLRCLQVLTEEAAVLGLSDTSAALRQAIAACRAERGNNAADPAATADPMRFN